MPPPPPRSTLFPYTTLFRSYAAYVLAEDLRSSGVTAVVVAGVILGRDRKSTRLNSSHLGISYAVFCLKKKTQRNVVFLVSTSGSLTELNPGPHRHHSLHHIS